MNDILEEGCDVLLVGYEIEENIGLRSIAAFLESKGLNVGIEPYQSTAKENVLKRIRMENPKIVGFSLIFQRMLPDFAELVSYLRNEGVQAHFNMGGHFPTIACEETLRLIPGLDTAVRHEGELTLLELYQQLDRPDLWPLINGIAYFRDGRINITPPRGLIEDLDSLPFIKRKQNIQTHRGLGFCSMLTSRGCYHNCSFCSVQTFYGGAPGPKRRSRSPSNVALEMEQLFKLGIRIFNFKDDDFAMNTPSRQKWIETFARELEKKRISNKIFWRISCRVDELDSGMLSRLSQVGLSYLYMGIESGCMQGLNVANKRYRVEDISRSLGILQDLGMEFEYGFMLFDPESTFDSIKENIAFLGDLCKDGRAVVHFTKMMPYVGTAISELLMDGGRLTGNVVFPDYNYKDPRIDLLEIFFTRVFHNMMFEEDGLVYLLQFVMFDSVVLEKFFSGKYDTRTYAESVRNLTKRCNESVLETMSMAVRFMETYSYEDILYHWNVLDILAQEELDVQKKIKVELNRLKPIELI